MARILFWPLLALFVATPVIASGDENQTATQTLTEAALGQVRADQKPFHLEVDCGSERGPRSLVLYPNAIAHWDGRFEYRASAAEQKAFLDLLIQNQFTELAPAYGGKQGHSLSAKAPARISCRIEFKSGDFYKQSHQFVDNYQSPDLHRLANALLDSAERSARARGVAAADLMDGLNKIATGELSGHALRLRLLALPEDGTVGRIFEVVDGQFRVRDYAPGRTLGENRSSSVTEPELVAIVKAIQTADIEALPVNLWSEGQTELQVEVLGHRKTLIGRQFLRLTASSLGDQQRRFNRMISELQRVAQIIARRA